MVTRLLKQTDLKWNIVIWAGLLITLVFAVVISLTSLMFAERLKQSVYHDVATKNQGYVNYVYSVLETKMHLLLSIRDDLELYETRGQMWMHLAAHAGEKIFDEDPIYLDSFQQKLNFYKQNGQLSTDKLTPQLVKIMSNVTTSQNKYGDGMKFFYLGVATKRDDPLIQQYDQYQDSSLWVPDSRIDKPYNPLVRPWYLAGQKAGRDTIRFTEPYSERRTQEAITSAATTINIEGEVGTLAAGISIKPIIDKLVTLFDDHSQVTILSKGAAQSTEFVSTYPSYIYSSRDATLSEDIKQYNAADIIDNQSNLDIMKLYDATIDSKQGVLEWVINGEDRLVAYGTIPEVGWKIFNSVSKAEMMAGATTLKYLTMTISLAGLLTLLTALFFIVQKSTYPLEQIGAQLKHLAKTGNLSTRIDVSSENEIGKMANAINDMLDNVAAPVQKLSNKAKTIAQGDLSPISNIHSKGDIADLVDSFNNMTHQLIEFHQTIRDASPLTGLPGGITIETLVKNNIDHGTPFAFCMFDLDNFKPFNDRYGYSRGNEVIKHTAFLIEKNAKSLGNANDFVGHIGGDDFVIVTTNDRYIKICEKVISEFDETIINFYDKQDRDEGKIISKNRRGKTETFPIMSISVCAIDSQDYTFDDYVEVGEVIAELKSYAKKQPGSILMVERRKR